MTTHFFTPLFCCCFWIRDPRSEEPGWVKIRIRDKHPGSATLLVHIESFFSLRLAPKCCTTGTFALDCGMLEFFKYSTHEFWFLYETARTMNSFQICKVKIVNQKPIAVDVLFKANPMTMILFSGWPNLVSLTLFLEKRQIWIHYHKASCFP